MSFKAKIPQLGPRGLPGAQIVKLTEDAAPGTEEGNEGDFALRPGPGENTTLYGPKTDGEWGAGRQLRGGQGAQGLPGDRGWTPRLAIVLDDGAAYLQVSDWVGGTGTKPATGHYVGAEGLVEEIGDAVFLPAQIAAAIQFGEISVADALNALDVAKLDTDQNPLRGHIFGLTLSNNTSDATNDIDIAPGEAASTEASPVLMVLASAITKRLDAAWAVGDGNGGLDTGSIANTTYHVWLIRRSDTGVVDALFSASATSPTMPTGYDQKRRIGAIVRAGGAIVLFTQQGDEFLRKVPITDVNVTDPGETAVLRTLSLPVGLKIIAILSARISENSATGAASVLLTSPDQDNTAASNALATFMGPGAVMRGGTGQAFVRTNASAQIRSRVAGNTTSTALIIVSHGWIDTRGRLA